ncbi:hypothetical protein BS50DRAFT_657388 [Corynespora cassiicola Philippines]|uniref:Uncharacterized protein n=1 Tax=Corynespora cassiicola Philippines TaxID=1448308 RepID=A0A2T2P1Z4_CORCC|nr:hypothetical protein BS50DRAFT_657388 [Corynespora cassiicola Philippines]
MTDGSAKSLLAPYGDLTKPYRGLSGARNAYKTPLAILFLFIVLVGTMGAAAVVLLASHESPVGRWRVQPSVLLAILTGVYIVTLAALLSVGVAITWWRSFINGTSLRKLHYIHAGAGASDYIPAIAAGGSARRVALAAFVVFAAKLAVGPLLQRSTGVVLRNVAQDADMQIRIADDIPEGYFGTQSRLSAKGVRASQQTLSGPNLTTTSEKGYSCEGDGRCEATVAAAGVNFGCGPLTKELDLLDDDNLNETIFSIAMEIRYDYKQPILFITSKYISSIGSDCKATITEDTCGVIPAVVPYPIVIQNSSLAVDLDSVVENRQIVRNSTSKQDVETDDPNAALGTLQGILSSLGPIFISEARLSNDSTGRTYTTQQPWPHLFYQDSSSAPSECPLLFTSPSHPLLKNTFSLSFLAAYDAAQSKPSTSQPLAATLRTTQLRHSTSYPHLAAALAAMTAGILAALVPFWRFWALDRFVTLSPLETAKALAAPVLAGAAPEQEAAAIVRVLGHERVAYDEGGEVVWSGSVYASGLGYMGTVRGRGRASEPRYFTAVPVGSSDSAPVGGSVRGRKQSSSVHEANVQPSRPSFEHSYGVTTRKLYDDEEEVDVGLYGRARSASRGSAGPSDTVPMLPMPVNLSPANSGLGQNLLSTISGAVSPTAAGVGGGFGAASPSPSGGRSRRASLSAGAKGRRPLSLIQEGNSPVEDRL